MIIKGSIKRFLLMTDRNGTMGRLKPTLGRVPRVGSNLGEVPWVGTQGTYPGYLPKVI